MSLQTILTDNNLDLHFGTLNIKRIAPIQLTLNNSVYFDGENVLVDPVVVLYKVGQLVTIKISPIVVSNDAGASELDIAVDNLPYLPADALDAEGYYVGEVTGVSQDTPNVTRIFYSLKNLLGTDHKTFTFKYGGGNFTPAVGDTQTGLPKFVFFTYIAA